MLKYKKCKIVTTNAGYSKILAYNFITKELFVPLCSINFKECEYQHLHIISDDDIEVGDYVYNSASPSFSLNKIHKWGDADTTDSGVNMFNKIIASTDEKLQVLSIDINFIKKYIEMGFNEVLVSYEDKKPELEETLENLIESCHEFNGNMESSPYYPMYCDALRDFYDYKPKPISKNNIVSTKIIKSVFNRNELPVQAIKDCLKYCEN